MWLISSVYAFFGSMVAGALFSEKSYGWSLLPAAIAAGIIVLASYFTVWGTL
jgi:hypothetical protein